MLVGPGNLCIRWIVSQFRRMARKSPLESGRQRPKSVRNKMPLAQFLGLDAFDCVLIYQPILCMDWRRLV